MFIPPWWKENLILMQIRWGRPLRSAELYGVCRSRQDSRPLPSGNGQLFTQPAAFRSRGCSSAPSGLTWAKAKQQGRTRLRATPQSHDMRVALRRSAALSCQHLFQPEVTWPLAGLPDLSFKVRAVSPAGGAPSSWARCRTGPRPRKASGPRGPRGDVHPSRGPRQRPRDTQRRRQSLQAVLQRHRRGGLSGESPQNRGPGTGW